MTLSISEIQRAVGMEGLDVDGKRGPKTIEAIKTFQRENKLKYVDGIVTPGGPTEKLLLSVLSVKRVEPQATPKPTATVAGKTTWPTQANCPSFYGQPGHIEMSTITPPYPFFYDNRPMKTISVHKKIAAPVLRILTNVLDHYGAAQVHALKLDDFSGCYNPRKMRGGSAWSMHAFACALDFNAADNQLSWGRDRARFGKPIYVRWFELWEAEGAVSLGRTANYDWMHVQFARIR